MMNEVGSIRSRLDLSRLERITRRLERDASAGLIPGALIVVGHHDRIVFERAVGLRDVASGDPLQRDAIWRIYSMTKPIVSAAAMVLVENGDLHLEQPVADFIPSFANLRVASENGETAPAQRQPTIQDLLRHTAGLGYGYFGAGPVHEAYVADGLMNEDLPLAAFVDRVAALPLEYQPKTAWHYSHATDVLGRVLEVVVDKELDEVLRCTLLGPLGMEETGFRAASSQHNRIAQPLPRSSSAPAGMPQQFFDPTALRRLQSAGGGLVSTAADYSRFLRMLLGRGSLEGGRLLAPSIVDHMTSDHIGAIRRDSYYPQGPGYGFGLGFAVRTTRGEAPFPGSLGDYSWSGVGGTYFWVDPLRDLFVLFMLQTASPKQRLHYRILVRNMVYAAVED
jgi:CubicO group peptidase (beta-lactamase class C family)